MLGWAMGSLQDILNGILDGIGTALWDAISPLITWVFAFLEGAASPTITYDSSGPTASIWPTLLWTGLFGAVLFAFMEIAQVVMAGGKGLGESLLRFVKWIVSYNVGLGLIALVVKFSDVLGKSIIDAGFGTAEGWKSLGTNSSFMGATIQGISGITLAILSLFFILPFAFTLLAEVIIREGSMEILAATYPILTAGLISSKFERWFWKGMRWMMALVFSTPMMALAMVIAHGLVMSASHMSESAPSAFVTALVGAAAGSLGLISPLALFKLFAFADPNMSGGVNSSGVLSNLRNRQGSDSSDGETGGGKKKGSGSPDGEMTSEGTDSSSANSRTNSANGGGTFANAARSVGSGAAGLMLGAGSASAGRSAARASSSLDAIGAGHPGMQAGNPDDDDSKSSNKGQKPKEREETDAPTGQPFENIPGGGGGMPGGGGGMPGGGGGGMPGGGGGGMPGGGGGGGGGGGAAGGGAAAGGAAEAAVVLV